MEERRLVAVEVLDRQDHQQRPRRLQLFSVTMTRCAKTQRLTQFSTLAMAPHTLSRATNITDSPRMPLLLDIRNRSLRDGRDSLATSTPLSLIRTAKHISSRDRSTGDTMAAILMAIIQRKSTKDSLECRTTSTLQWCGEETAKFTSTKEASSGDLTHSSDLQSSRPTPNQSATGKAFQMTLTLPSNTPTATLTSSKVINITDSTTERSR
jgi:hypothetical protein